jgi:hypothetical protein
MLLVLGRILTHVALPTASGKLSDFLIKQWFADQGIYNIAMEFWLHPGQTYLGFAQNPSKYEVMFRFDQEGLTLVLISVGMTHLPRWYCGAVFE